MDRTRLNEIVKRATGCVVESGPFQGMHLIDKFSWGDGDISSKLLGMYEQELHRHVEAFSSGKYECVIDVGCAEGFYAVGLARLFPALKIYAHDSNPIALAVAKEAAMTNKVVDRVVFGGHLSSENLISIVNDHGRSLIIVDCEGYEFELLCRPDVAAALKNCDLIVECHDYLNGHITPNIFLNYLPSHIIETEWAAGRNPNAYPILANLTDPERWGLCSENRMCRQHWLILKAKCR